MGLSKIKKYITSEIKNKPDKIKSSLVNAGEKVSEAEDDKRSYTECSMKRKEDWKKKKRTVSVTCGTLTRSLKL